MATAEEIRICRVCKSVLGNGVCPEGHSQRKPGATRQWPIWAQQPTPLWNQMISKAEQDKAERTANSSIGDMARVRLDELDDAISLLPDEVADRMILDCVEIVKGMLRHKRSPEFIKKVVATSKKMSTIAAAIENYIKETGTTEI